MIDEAPTTSIQITLVGYALVFVFSLIALFVSKKAWSIWTKRRLGKITASNQPILLHFFSQGANLDVLKSGFINDMPYVTYFAQNYNDMSRSSVIVVVNLPFKTNLHLLGIPKGDGATQLNPAKEGSVMEEVHLEGDYQNYFRLYADKGQQVESRYHLDPAAMIFTIDFCQAHSWEIVGGTLYFLTEATTDTNSDDSLMIDDVAPFVEQIRPAIEA